MEESNDEILPDTVPSRGHKRKEAASSSKLGEAEPTVTMPNYRERATRSKMGIQSFIKHEDTVEGNIQCPVCNYIICVGEKGCNVITCRNHFPQFLYFCLHCKEICAQEYATCPCSKRNTMTTRTQAQKERNRAAQKNPISIDSSEEDNDAEEKDDDREEKYDEESSEQSSEFVEDESEDGDEEPPSAQATLPSDGDNRTSIKQHITSTGGGSRDDSEINPTGQLNVKEEDIFLTSNARPRVKQEKPHDDSHQEGTSTTLLPMVKQEEAPPGEESETPNSSSGDSAREDPSNYHAQSSSQKEPTRRLRRLRRWRVKNASHDEVQQRPQTQALAGSDSTTEFFLDPIPKKPKGSVAHCPEKIKSLLVGTALSLEFTPPAFFCHGCNCDLQFKKELKRHLRQNKKCTEHVRKNNIVTLKAMEASGKAHPATTKAQMHAPPQMAIKVLGDFKSERALTSAATVIKRHYELALAKQELKDHRASEEMDRLFRETVGEYNQYTSYLGDTLISYDPLDAHVVDAKRNYGGEQLLNLLLLYQCPNHACEGQNKLGVIFSLPIGYGNVLTREYAHECLECYAKNAPLDGRMHCWNTQKASRFFKVGRLSPQLRKSRPLAPAQSQFSAHEVTWNLMKVFDGRIWDAYFYPFQINNPQSGDPYLMVRKRFDS